MQIISKILMRMSWDMGQQFNAATAVAVWIFSPFSIHRFNGRLNTVFNVAKIWKISLRILATAPSIVGIVMFS